MKIETGMLKKKVGVMLGHHQAMGREQAAMALEWVRAVITGLESDAEAARLQVDNESLRRYTVTLEDQLDPPKDSSPWHSKLDESRCNCSLRGSEKMTNHDPLCAVFTPDVGEQQSEDSADDESPPG